MTTKHTITLSALNPDITYSVKDNSVRGCHTAHFDDLVIGDKIVIDDYFHEIIPEPEKTEPAKPRKISISAGNTKMGAIPSVSLPPVITCPSDCPCSKKCYAAKLCRIYPTVRKAYQNNLDILLTNPALYWDGVYNAAKMTKFFRWHVSGDIPNLEYFARMVSLAQVIPGTQFLAFTKRYNIINDYINHGGVIPGNLKIIFSEWEGMETPNPHNLPTAAVIFKGQQPREDWKICGGNCAACACRGVGCWELKNGETIAFYEH